MTSSVVRRLAMQTALLGTLLASRTFPGIAGHPAAARREVRLLFTGDILLSRQVETEMTRQHSWPWIHLRRLFESADWTGGNLEGAVGSASDCQPGKIPCFPISPASIDLLKRAGFHGLTVENNHAGDLGSAGRVRTLKSLRQAGIEAIDFENSPQFLRLNGVEFALIAVSTVPAADGRVQELPSGAVADKLRFARQRAAIVIVSVHWGNELMPWPSHAQRKDAAWLVAHGADLVLGHHPHVIQSPECVQGKPVFFSLGNHVFDQANPSTKEGLIADCRVDNSRLRCQGIRSFTRAGSSFPSMTNIDRGSAAALARCGEVSNTINGSEPAARASRAN